MSIIELAAKAKEIKELTRMKEELEVEISTLQDEIKSTMQERGIEEIAVGEYKIRFTTVQSNRFDTSAFKATHKELYAQYLKQTVTKRFAIA